MEDTVNVEQFIQEMPNEVMERLQFAMPWQNSSSSETKQDSDGFDVFPDDKDDPSITRQVLQSHCWDKFQRSPQINTAVRGIQGRLTGWGYEVTSENEMIQDIIDDVSYDHRNRLYDLMPKYVGRSHVEGELYLSLTVHPPPSVFVEIDFIDPSSINTGGTDGTGILFHPFKTVMPLFYNISQNTTGLMNTTVQIPSIYIARYPELVSIAKKDPSNMYDRALQQGSRSRKHVYKPFAGYTRFIVSWNRGLVTKRAISYLRTTLEWLNHYENLKKYEIDHKKSSGAYLWVFTIVDAKSFKIWLSLSDEDRLKTGVMQKKTPGGTLVLPPGMEVKIVNPQLASITDEDNDIKEMVTSGLNEPADVSSGTSSGTFASVKASRGPMSDRTSDEIAWFDRWQKFDFWSSILFFYTKLSDLPDKIPMEECVGFTNKEKYEKNDETGLMEMKYEHKPIFKTKKKRPEHLIDISYPDSEVTDYEARAKGWMGTKHGPVSETLGVSGKTIAGKMGIESYGKERLRKETEKRMYPTLVYTVDAEAKQEKAEAEPGKKKAATEETKPDKKKEEK